ncbi:phage holin family protein [Phyllobacterium sp. SYP-B3895]|uniref:phage holin family protein n=1 Tax=Phyllobacterium sp. SYP-B3895 TaxID=2663240 RepID=UPI0012999C39|nr:phage holin family protein [Phyllobacterium sp. SYP-B3895]MRG58040.1 phage holin family protein [Phyllobacterium sp. SYP-B3895]
MSEVNQNRPLPELIGGLLTDVSGLVRKEITLAKAEASESVSRALGGIEALAIGLVLAIGAMGVLLGAVVAGLTTVLVAQGYSQPGSNAAAALIVGILVAIAAWATISKGVSALKANNWKLERTAASISRDADVIKEKTS